MLRRVDKIKLIEGENGLVPVEKRHVWRINALVITAHGRSTYGYPPQVWERAKKESKAVLRRVARKESDIAYSELTAKIDSIAFDPHDHMFHDFLGQVSIDEDAAGRGMLSALVVHKDGDRMPGPGFFELATFLGRRYTDKVALWVEEVQRVYAAHKR